MPASAARALRDPPPAPPPPAADLLRAHNVARSAENLERLGRIESKVVIAGGVLSLLACLTSIVWLLATLNAHVAAIREEMPPGTVQRYFALLEGYDRRLQLLEDAEDAK